MSHLGDGCAVVEVAKFRCLKPAVAPAATISSGVVELYATIDRNADDIVKTSLVYQFAQRRDLEARSG